MLQQAVPDTGFSEFTHVWCNLCSKIFMAVAFDLLQPNARQKHDEVCVQGLS